MPHRSRRRHETEHDESEETRNNTLLTKNYNLLEWVDNLEMGSPNLFIPQQIADYVGSTSFCRFAISPCLNRIAIMNFNRELKVYTLEGDVMRPESSVQVLEDEFPEYCLLQYSECGSLILSTRSNAQIDVFDYSGRYCYDIPLETSSAGIDLRSAISCMQTTKYVSSAPDEPKFVNWLYVLQYNGTFTALKIGSLARYCQIWSTQLNIGLASTFTLLKEYNLLLVGAHYPVKCEVKPPGGLCSFRLVDGEPYLDPIRVLNDSSGWLKHLPFTSSHYAFLSTLSLSFSTPRKLLAVSTNGDLVMYDLPSTNASTIVKHISGPRPVQATFIDENEVAVMFSDGSLLRCEPDNLQDTVLEFHASEKFEGRAEIVSPGARELFLLVENAGSGAHRELVSERTFLAARIWLYTIWSTFKSLIGMAVGDSPMPLQMVKHADSFSFTLWYLPTRTLQQLLDRTLNDKDFEGAKKLAEEYDSIDMNVILKREWHDICASDSVTVDAVSEILERINDSDWIAEAAATCTSSNLEAQRALVNLGLLQENVSIDTSIRLLHNARVLSVCTDVSFYLDHRSNSLLAVTFELAKAGDIAGLQKILEKNLELLLPFILAIIDKIPPALPPNKYSGLFPVPGGKLKDVHEEVGRELYELEVSLCKANPSLMFAMNFGGTDAEQETDYFAWVRKRAAAIEADTGLYSHSLQLLEICYDNGFKELERDISTWKQFISFVRMCSSISETFSGFSNLTAETLVSKISSITESELIQEAANVLSLLESVVERNVDLRRFIRPLVINSCETSTKVLKAFKEIRPDIFDKELITQCLSQSPLTGNELIAELGSFSEYEDIRSALLTLRDLGVKPTFRRILDSASDSVVARSILMQGIANMRATSQEEWESFKDSLLQLADSNYHKLVPRKEVLQLLAKELLLNDSLRMNSSLLKTLLTLERGGPKEFDGIKLGQVESAETLMTLSVDVMNDAVQKNDPSLDKSRFFATLAKPIAPKQAQEQLRLLDAIDIMYDLGCTLMPAQVRLHDPMQLLQQLIDIGTNYKKGKSLAKLATLLEISTPVSTALSLAALAAIEHNDEDTLAKYIAEIMKARDIPVVHKLCIQIIKSQYVSSALEDVYACCLLNCPHDDLAVTLELIEDSRKRRRTIIPSISEPSSDIVVDASCSTVDGYSKRESMSENCRFALANLSSAANSAEAARVWSRESASTAVVMALLGEERKDNVDSWTDNDVLQRYEKALRHFLPKLTPNLVQVVPPRVLIDKYNRIHGTDSPLDRIELQGVNRERFVADPAYRADSLDGLAMTEDDAVFADAVSLASQFYVDDWQLHMMSLENALTTCKPAEAKRILKARGHLSRLKTNISRFHSSLRANVLPLLETNEMFIAYLSLFAEDQPEKHASPTLKKILERKKDLNAKRLFTDRQYLTNTITTMPDKFIIGLSEGFRLYPVGVEACETAASFLLNGTDVRPPASVIALSALLGDDETALVDLIASKPLDDEIQYLKQASVILEATPNAAERLIGLVKDRLALLTTPVEPSPEPEQPTFVLTSRRRH